MRRGMGRLLFRLAVLGPLGPHSGVLVPIGDAECGGSQNGSNHSHWDIWSIGGELSDSSARTLLR